MDWSFGTVADVPGPESYTVAQLIADKFSQGLDWRPPVPSTQMMARFNSLGDLYLSEEIEKSATLILKTSDALQVLAILKRYQRLQNEKLKVSPVSSIVIVK